MQHEETTMPQSPLYLPTSPGTRAYAAALDVMEASKDYRDKKRQARQAAAELFSAERKLMQAYKDYYKAKGGIAGAMPSIIIVDDIASILNDEETLAEI